LWLAFPQQNREQTLRVLRRVLTQQLAWPAATAKEVAHDQP
jgi:hypothetical protein